MDELQKQISKELRRIKRFMREAEKRGFSFPESSIPKEPKKVTQSYVRRLQNINPQTLYKKAKYKAPTGEIVSGTEGRNLERQAAAKKAARTRQAQGKTSPSKSTKTGQTPQATKPKQKSQQRKKKSTTSKKSTPRKTQQKQGTTKKKQPSAPRKKKQAHATGNGKKKPTGGDGRKKNPPDYNPPHAQDNVLQHVEEELYKWEPPSYWTESYKEYKRGHVTIAKHILQGAIMQYGRDEVTRRLEYNADKVNELIDIICYDSEQSRVQMALVTLSTILHDRPLTPDESAELTDIEEYYENYDEDDGDDEDE